jgi:hypothetical protein
MHASILCAIVLAISVVAHPPVSNPHRVQHQNENEIEDLYTLFANERPQYTTALMAQASSGAARSGNEELKW